jgi:hypothetical protein
VKSSDLVTDHTLKVSVVFDLGALNNMKRRSDICNWQRQIEVAGDDSDELP